MENQFIDALVRAETELDAEVPKIADDEGSALIGTQFVGGLTPDCQREFSRVVLPDNYSRAPLAERAGAALKEGLEGFTA